MISPNELRIGNLIYIDNREKPIYIHEVSAHDIEEISGYGEDCFSIQLTPAWLIRAGFIKEQSNDQEERDIYSIQVANNTSLYYDPTEDNKTWYLSSEWNNNHYKNDFWGCPTSLHQLQNLYYALTGEELKISDI